MDSTELRIIAMGEAHLRYRTYRETHLAEIGEGGIDFGFVADLLIQMHEAVAQARDFGYATEALDKFLFGRLGTSTTQYSAIVAETFERIRSAGLMSSAEMQDLLENLYQAGRQEVEMRYEAKSEEPSPFPTPGAGFCSCPVCRQERQSQQYRQYRGG